MPRRARVAVPGQPHHVTQRANRRADVFLCDGDRSRYREFLRQYSERSGLTILDGVGPGVWQAHPAEPVTEEDAERLRNPTQSGLPCGDEGFLARVSGLVGRPLIGCGRGRLRKAVEEQGDAG